MKNYNCMRQSPAGDTVIQLEQGRTSLWLPFADWHFQQRQKNKMCSAFLARISNSVWQTCRGQMWRADQKQKNVKQHWRVKSVARKTRKTAEDSRKTKTRKTRKTNTTQRAKLLAEKKGRQKSVLRLLSFSTVFSFTVLHCFALFSHFPFSIFIFIQSARFNWLQLHVNAAIWAKRAAY